MKAAERLKPFRGFESHPRRVHHVIRPRPPVGGAVLGGATVVLGLVGFAVAEATGQYGWAVAGAAVLLVGLVLLATVSVLWRRGGLVVDTDSQGLTATAAGSRATARWEEVSAVTATDDELRIRRNAGQALVLRLPAGAHLSQVTTLTDDVAERLDQRRA